MQICMYLKPIIICLLAQGAGDNAVVVRSFDVVVSLFGRRYLAQIAPPPEQLTSLNHGRKAVAGFSFLFLFPLS